MADVPKDLIEYVDDASMQKIIEEWDRYDKDQSGTITAEEFKAGERAWYISVNPGKEITAEELESKLALFMRTQDKDKNNEVGWFEFANSKALLILDNKEELHNCLTASERADAQAAFDSIDSDRSGQISPTEARAYYDAKYDRDVKNNLRTRRNAQQEAENSVRRLFRTHDKGDDQLISFEEFIREEAKSIISDRSLAGSDSGSLTRVAAAAPKADNIEEVCQVLSADQIEHARIKFDELDVDSSGTIEFKELTKLRKELALKVSAKEFKNVLAQNFKRIDANEDAKLDFEEFKHMYNWLYLNFSVNFEDM